MTDCPHRNWLRRGHPPWPPLSKGGKLLAVALVVVAFLGGAAVGIRHWLPSLLGFSSRRQIETARAAYATRDGSVL